MEKKLIPIILIVLLVGLGGGYGLGYVIYQPQIQNLQSDLKQLNNELETINSEIADLNSTINSEIANLNSTIVNLENETWHFVTNFTLSEEEPKSSLFFIQGEKWRVRWEPLTITSWSGFFIWDENGYAIEGVQVGYILGQYHDAKGIHYVTQGEGNYCIESLPGPNVNFTIESYH
jgi:hypothetical protein